MSGTDSIKGLIALSINIDFGKQSKNDEKIKLLENHGFKLLTGDDLSKEEQKYNLKNIVFIEGCSYYLYNFSDSKSYTILQVEEGDFEKSTAFVVIQQDSKILELPKQFLRECNLKWRERILARIKNQSFKITLRSLQDVKAYIATDRSTVFASDFPLKYDPLKINWPRLIIGIAMWAGVVFSINVSKSYLNYSWIEHTTPFLFSIVGLIASYILKTDIECFLSFITDSQETKLTLTGLVMNEAASNKAKETNDRVDEVNREFSNLKPVNK